MVRIESVTAEILLILSFCGGGVCKVILLSKPTIVLRLGWGFDNDHVKSPKVKRFGDIRLIGIPVLVLFMNMNLTQRT